MNIDILEKTGLQLTDIEHKSFNQKLKILMVEDMESDAELVERELRTSGFIYTLTRVDNKPGFLSELYNNTPDIILADYSLPQFSGLEALMLLKKFNTDIPFILVTGTQSEEVAVECMKEGADDYVLKSALKRLAPAMKNALKNSDIKKEKNRIEAALRRSEEHYRLITENTQDLVCMLDIEGNFLYLSPSYKEALGYRQQDLIGINFFTLIHPGDLDFVMLTWEQALTDMKSKRIEFRFRHRDSRWKCFEANANWIFNDSGLPQKALVVSRDITERKDAEEKIRLLAHAVESTHEYISITDLDNKFIFVNNAFLEAYGYKHEEILGKTPFILDSGNNPDTLRSEIMMHTRNGGWKGELLNRTKSGREFPIFLSTNEILNEKGKVIGHIGVASNVTERKKAEEKIKSSLKEKEIILKEIHHRVKNNLQVISSIFYLQGEKVNDPRLHEIINECKNRVRSMAIIHENFYQSDDLTRIDFGQYLKNLINNLMISYGIENDRIDIDLRVSDTFLSIDVAIPCGLLVNEIISNAIKHAFPGDVSGNITIEMFSPNSHDFTLRIKDNGIGIPDNIDISNTGTLGMELITTLTSQLEGSIELNKSQGTEFIIKFAV
jgi:two-component system sensor kinase